MRVARKGGGFLSIFFGTAARDVKRQGVGFELPMVKPKEKKIIIGIKK